MLKIWSAWDLNSTFPAHETNALQSAVVLGLLFFIIYYFLFRMINWS